MYKIKVKILVMLGLKWKYQEEFLSYFFPSLHICWLCL